MSLRGWLHTNMWRVLSDFCTTTLLRIANYNCPFIAHFVLSPLGEICVEHNIMRLNIKLIQLATFLYFLAHRTCYLIDSFVMMQWSWIQCCVRYRTLFSASSLPPCLFPWRCRLLRFFLQIIFAIQCRLVSVPYPVFQLGWEKGRVQKKSGTI